MSLWSKYATLVGRFEPTRRWEEAALIFSMIQAKRWKNQLFNYHWSLQKKPGMLRDLSEALSSDFELEKPKNAPEAEASAPSCRVLPFKPV
jgi:hypothetical protein